MITLCNFCGKPCHQENGVWVHDDPAPHEAAPGRQIQTKDNGQAECTPGHEETCRKGEGVNCRCKCGGLNHGKDAR